MQPREITAEWCSRFAPRPKLEDVIAGAVGLNDRQLGYNVNFLYPARGVGQLSRALAEGLSGRIYLDRAAARKESGHAPPGAQCGRPWVAHL